MKKFTTALIVAALMAPAIGAAPAMAQAAHRNDHGRPVAANNQGAHRPAVSRPAARTQAPSYRTFRKGERFDRNRARNYQVVDYRKYRNVKAPPRGYHYVRSGNDLLLVGITSGIISAVTSGMFR